MPHEGRGDLLLGGFRPGLLTALAIAGALVAASTSFGSAAPAGAGCTPIVRTLENGDPAITDGAVRVPVDGLGAFGRGAVAGADAIFNPPGGFAPLGTTYTSNLYLSTAGRMLADDCVDGQVQLLSENPLTTRLQLGSLQVDVRQELGPVTLGGSTLRQTYTLTNTGGSDIAAHLVRHLDGDLRFNGSTDDGAAASGPDGHTLTEFDSTSTGVPRVLLQVAGALGSSETPDEWTIQPFNYRPVIEGAGGIPPRTAASSSTTRTAISLRTAPTTSRSASSGTRRSRRRQRGTRDLDPVRRGGPEPTAVDDSARTGRDQSVDVDVRANDSDPDGDALDGRQRHSTGAWLRRDPTDGTIRYAPASGFEGRDSFTYTVGDGRGGAATAEVSVNVATYTLSVARTGNGGVTSTPPGIDCGTTCSGRLRQRFDRDARRASRPRLDARRVERSVHRHGLLHGEHGRGQVRQRRLPASPSDPRVDRQPVARERHGLLQGSKLRRHGPPRRFGAGADRTEVDTTDGVAKVTVARGPTLDTSEFYDGDFTVLQPGPKALGELPAQGRQLPRLRVARSAHWRRSATSAVSGAAAEGTSGRAAATRRRPVRGTKWLTEDLCDSTRITVVQGVVLVHDFVRNVDVSVPAGHSYRADALPRSVRNAGCTIVGTEQRDFLRGTPGKDVICGLGGDDVLFGMGGDDRLIGGPGDDRILAGPGDDVLVGNAGKDFLKGGAGHDVLEGGDGNDFMAAHDGGRGNDRLTGGGGRDLCYTDYVRVCP